MFKPMLAALALTALTGHAGAESAFDTLAGIDAEAMSASEMEATQGRAIRNGSNPFTGRIETCVSGYCTGSNFGNLFDLPTGGGSYPWFTIVNPYPGTYWDTVTEIANQPPAYLR
jgi:hypothetical protein